MLEVGDKVKIINACGGGPHRRKLLNLETYITEVDWNPEFVRLNINNGTDWWVKDRLKKINDE